MTTDAYPKLRSVDLGSGRIVAIAKGAGMIEPNMATMLVFIFTDIDLPREDLRAALHQAVDLSFNRISVDGDQSTSDMAIIVSSRMAGSVPLGDFQQALNSVCQPLADDIVRNGEGTAHVMNVRIKGAQTDADACGFGKAVINSPLVKTAVYGNDPNVGRILMALGDYAGNHDVPISPEKTTVTICGHPVYHHGAFDLSPEKESAVSMALQSAMLQTAELGYPSHDKSVTIDIDVGIGSGQSEVLGSDLSYEYVRENADYRT
jgi:glutamate N-acetyltransferase/amino-acid N-acetyltransferase